MCEFAAWLPFFDYGNSTVAQVFSCKAYEPMHESSIHWARINGTTINYRLYNCNVCAIVHVVQFRTRWSQFILMQSEKQLSPDQLSQASELLLCYCIEATTDDRRLYESDIRPWKKIVEQSSLCRLELDIDTAQMMNIRCHRRLSTALMK